MARKIGVVLFLFSLIFALASCGIKADGYAEGFEIPSDFAESSCGDSIRMGFMADVPARKKFMITFDDGPGSISTPYILDQLKNIKKADGTPVKAGFFLVGQDKSRASCWDIWKCTFWRCVPWWPAGLCPDPGVISNPNIVQRIANEGHFIGIHTQHHPDLEELTPEDVNSEIIDCYTAIQSTGVTPMKVFRSPYLHDPKNIPGSLQDWKKVRGEPTGDANPFISEEAVIGNCKEKMKQANEPITFFFHDFRGLPGHRFNFGNIVNKLVKEGYELVDFDPNTASQGLSTISTNTSSGDNVLVILPANNYVQFSKVTNAGETNTTIAENGPPLPSDYVPLGACYDVTATAEYNGPVTVTFACDVSSQKWVRLLHYKGDQWVDITNPDQLGVKIALGYPARHRTPSLESNHWIYWTGRHNTIAVDFDGSGKVASK